MINNYLKLVISLLFVTNVVSQTQFIKYTNSLIRDKFINQISIDSLGNKWIGGSSSDFGLCKFDGTNWSNYDTYNSGIPNNLILSLAIDSYGNKWVGTLGNSGLTEFDGVNWKTYNTSNSGISDNFIGSIKFDNQGTKWIGTFSGLCKFDGVNWKTYNTSNSGISNNSVNCLAIDKQGNKWIGTSSGLCKFDGVNWETYNTSNSGILSNSINCLSIDNKGNKWIATSKGLSKFDGINWTSYNISNSGLTSNEIQCISSDSFGNVWIGTNYYGLCKFDGNIWTTFNLQTANNSVANFAIDSQGYMWITDFGTLISFNTLCPKPFPKPTISSQSDTTFCEGNFVNLNSSIGVNCSYQWYSNNQLINGATASTYRASLPGIYTVKITDGTCNATSKAIVVTVNPLPYVSMNVISNVVYKSSSPIQLISSPSGGTFSGDGVVGTRFNPSLTALGTKTITYKYTSTQGCSGITSRSTIVVDSIGNVCSTYDTLKIKVKLTTGINTNQYTSMRVYPNPTSDLLIIDASDIQALIGYRYRILDLQGKEIYNAFVTTVKTEVSLKSLGTKGVYVLHVIDANNASIQTKQILLE